MKSLKNLARSAFFVSALCLAFTGCSEDEKPKRKATEVRDPSEQDIESRIIKIDNRHSLDAVHVHKLRWRDGHGSHYSWMRR